MAVGWKGALRTPRAGGVCGCHGRGCRPSPPVPVGRFPYAVVGGGWGRGQSSLRSPLRMRSWPSLPCAARAATSAWRDRTPGAQLPVVVWGGVALLACPFPLLWWWWWWWWLSGLAFRSFGRLCLRLPLLLRLGRRWGRCRGGCARWWRGWLRRWCGRRLGPCRGVGRRCGGCWLRLLCGESVASLVHLHRHGAGLTSLLLLLSSEVCGCESGPERLS